MLATNHCFRSLRNELLKPVGENECIGIATDDELVSDALGHDGNENNVDDFAVQIVLNPVITRVECLLLRSKGVCWLLQNVFATSTALKCIVRFPL